PLRARIRPRPPRPLFPYTTLFRSALAAAEEAVTSTEAWLGGRDDAIVAGTTLGGNDGWSARLGGARNGPSPLSDGAPHAGTRLLDRKSTRLNSSHLVTPYAVFCLK